MIQEREMESLRSLVRRLGPMAVALAAAVLIGACGTISNVADPSDIEAVADEDAPVAAKPGQALVVVLSLHTATCCGARPSPEVALAPDAAASETFIEVDGLIPSKSFACAHVPPGDYRVHARFLEAESSLRLPAEPGRITYVGVVTEDADDPESPLLVRTMDDLEGRYYLTEAVRHGDSTALHSGDAMVHRIFNEWVQHKATGELKLKLRCRNPW